MKWILNLVLYKIINYVEKNPKIQKKKEAKSSYQKFYKNLTKLSYIGNI